MKNYQWFFAVLLSIALLQIACSKEPVDTDQPETVTPDYIGSWHLLILPAGDFIPDTLNIVMDINEDSTYSLELNQASRKTLFSSEGTWEATDDSLYLHGNECMILETVGDTLEPLAEDMCSEPISLLQPEKADEWNIQTSNLMVMMSALPIPSEALAAISMFMADIKLTKEN